MKPHQHDKRVEEVVPAGFRSRLGAARLELRGLFQTLDQLHYVQRPKALTHLLELDIEFMEALSLLDEPAGNYDVPAWMRDTLTSLDRVARTREEFLATLTAEQREQVLAHAKAIPPTTRKIPPTEVLPPSRATPNEFEGGWRITEMEVWDTDYIDMVVPGHITFDDESMGTFQFGAVQGWLDCRWVERDGKCGVEFSWEGEDDGDSKCGRGWANLEADGSLKGRFFIHRGDDSWFTATKGVPEPVPRKSKTRRRT